MTRTITAPSEASGEIRSLPGTSVPTEPGRAPEASRRRRRSRFPDLERPSPSQGSPARPAVRWTGSDDRLRELVGDHATAVGLDLVDAPSGPAPICIVTDPAGLTGRERALAASTAPLLVVIPDPEIAPEVWAAALTAGARAVVALPSRSEELLGHLAELARPRTASVLLGVVGGCGGAGASSFAARLAGAARRLGPVALIDADPLGGGLDLLVEAPPGEGIGWREAATLGPDDGEALNGGLPVVDGVRLLAAGMEPGPAAQALPPVLSALSAVGGTVVVDLSPGMVPVAAEQLHHLLVVVPSTDHAVRAAARRLRDWQLPEGLPRAVVRRSGPLTPGEVCEDLDLPLGAAFRDSPRGTVPLLDVRRRGADRAAQELLAQLALGERS